MEHRWIEEGGYLSNLWADSLKERPLMDCMSGLSRTCWSRERRMRGVGVGGGVAGYGAVVMVVEVGM